MFLLKDFLSIIANAFQAQESNTLISNILPIIFIFAILYLLIIRPQAKRQKDHRNLISRLTNNDEIVTTGGILGRINRIQDNYLIMEIAYISNKPIEIIIQKNAVLNILPKGTIKEL